jgi:hypothetical protein
MGVRVHGVPAGRLPNRYEGLNYGHRAGNFYIAGSPYAPNIFTVAPALNLMDIWPFVVPDTITIDLVSTRVNTAAPAGGVFRFGVWRDDGTLYPGALLRDLGTAPTDVIGLCSVVPAPDLILIPGLYWMSGVAQVAAGGAIKAVDQMVHPLMGSTDDAMISGATSLDRNCYTLAGISGALPDPAPAGGASLAAVYAVQYHVSAVA